MTRPFGQIEGFVGLEQGPAGLELRAGQEFPLAHCTLDGFHSSTTDPDPEMMKPGIIYKCQATLELNTKMLTDRQSA